MNVSALHAFSESWMHDATIPKTWGTGMGGKRGMKDIRVRGEGGNSHFGFANKMKITTGCL